MPDEGQPMLPCGSLRFEEGKGVESGMITGTFVQVDGKDIADLSRICAGVSFEARAREPGMWTVMFIADQDDDGDPLHRTWC